MSYTNFFCYVTVNKKNYKSRDTISHDIKLHVPPLSWYEITCLWDAKNVGTVTWHAQVTSYNMSYA